MGQDDWDQNFDKTFDRAKKFAFGWFIFCAIGAVASSAFGVWVIVKLLQHYGVI